MTQQISGEHKGFRYNISYYPPNGAICAHIYLPNGQIREIWNRPFRSFEEADAEIIRIIDEAHTELRDWIE